MSVKSLIKLIGCLLITVVVYGFANHRSALRKIKSINVSFTNDKVLFISDSNVNKLLIQNQDSITSVSLEKLDLNKSELRLVDNPMIRNAEVSISLDGQLQAVVEQRQPIARIMGQQQYIDSDNSLMPLSVEHSSHVPLVYGFDTKYQQELYDLLQYINKDNWLHEAITQLIINEKGEVNVKVRAYSYTILLGKMKDLDHKWMNYKAFIAKMKKDKRLKNVKTIDLRYHNQVISVKK